MRLDKGQPSGTNKSEGTGIPNNINTDNDKLNKDKELTDDYTDDDQKISDDVRSNNPNRNTDKDDATNAGGYKQ